MAGAWIEWTGGDGTRRRVELKRGLTVVGGARADVQVEGAESDQLHVWDQPAKLIFVGFGAPPTVGGAPFEERALKTGDVVEWRGLRLEFGGLMGAVIEEIPLAEPVRPAASARSGAPSAASAMPATGGFANPVAAAPGALSGAVSGAAPGAFSGAGQNMGQNMGQNTGFSAGSNASFGVDELFWRRLKAGMAVELGVADAAVARRWQDAVMRGEFDADACARDVLGAATGLNDLKLGERTTRLQRDLVMAPVAATARGSARKVKNVAQGMAAMIISQFVVLSVSLLLVMLALFVLRVRWQWSVDAFFDRISGIFGS
jgi:hypothetical protein